jgi:uncharacterized membrane protein
MNPLNIILTLLALAGTAFLLYLIYGEEDILQKK